MVWDRRDLAEQINRVEYYYYYYYYRKPNSSLVRSKREVYKYGDGTVLACASWSEAVVNAARASWANAVATILLNSTQLNSFARFKDDFWSRKVGKDAANAFQQNTSSNNNNNNNNNKKIFLKKKERSLQVA